MTIGSGGRGFGGGAFAPVSSGAGMRWLSTDCGGGLVLGVFGTLPSKASEAGH